MVASCGVFTGACSSDSGKSDGGSGGSGGAGATCSTPGGAVAGVANNHCREWTAAWSRRSLEVLRPDSSSGAPPADAGVLGGDYGPTNFGNTAFDDDCRYHVTWTSTPVCETPT